MSVQLFTDFDPSLSCLGRPADCHRRCVAWIGCLRGGPCHQHGLAQGLVLPCALALGLRPGQSRATLQGLHTESVSETQSFARVAPDIACTASPCGPVLAFQALEDYVHRVGRTGRAGASGRATSFYTDRDAVRPLHQPSRPCRLHTSPESPSGFLLECTAGRLTVHGVHVLGSVGTRTKRHGWPLVWMLCRAVPGGANKEGPC